MRGKRIATCTRNQSATRIPVADVEVEDVSRSGLNRDAGINRQLRAIVNRNVVLQDVRALGRHPMRVGNDIRGDRSQ